MWNPYIKIVNRLYSMVIIWIFTFWDSWKELSGKNNVSVFNSDWPYPQLGYLSLHQVNQWRRRSQIWRFPYCWYRVNYYDFLWVCFQWDVQRQWKQRGAKGQTNSHRILVCSLVIFRLIFIIRKLLSSTHQKIRIIRKVFPSRNLSWIMNDTSYFIFIVRWHIIPIGVW